MAREQHLEYCGVCNKQKFGMQQGIVCGLTDKIADFEASCNSFEENPAYKESWTPEKTSTACHRQSGRCEPPLYQLFIRRSDYISAHFGHHLAGKAGSVCLYLVQNTNVGGMWAYKWLIILCWKL